MEFINNLKRKIKQAGIESKKYLADPNHPYHEVAGFLKFQIICGYISIVLLTIYNLMIIYYFFKFDFINAINMVGRYLGIVGSFFTILLILYVVIDIAVFTFCIIFLKKLKNRDSDYLLFYHNMCVVCYVIMLILLFFDFADTFFRIIWFTVIVAALTYYYCTSVKVRVYFGGDDFLKKDHYIHFLLEENDNEINNNDNTRNNNTILNKDEFNNKNNSIQNIENSEIKNSIDSKDVGVVITNSQKSKDGKNKNIDDSNVQNNNKIKHDNISNNKKELEHTINNETKNNKVVETDSEKKKIARLSINSIVAEYREAIELSESIKKIDLKGAKWQFNKKQNAWNLILNNKISKDVIYIIDYINPITLKPCSSTYGFDGEGRMIVGWGIDKNGVYYYFDDDTYNVGKMCTGLKLIDISFLSTAPKKSKKGK